MLRLGAYRLVSRLGFGFKLLELVFDMRRVEAGLGFRRDKLVCLEVLRG